MAELPGDRSSRTLQTVSTSADIITTLVELDGARVTELANHLDLSKSAVYNHLTTLRQKNLVVKSGDDYELSYQFLLLGEYVRNRSQLYRVARPELDRLAEECGEYVHLSTEQHGLGINLYKVHGPKAVGSDYQTAKLQKPDYLHYSATGKALLAELPRERVDSIVERHGLVSRTANTITTPEALHEDLERIRERGYSCNDEEEIEGLRAVGAPICDREGTVLGSLSVSGPTSRLKGDRFHETIPELVMSTANVIEVNINMSDQSSNLPNLS
ncbi:IclR family transcriptional regulator [Haladaptatus sp. CMSO5]|uniref:IclR family transcriptional regulator n=1 Tax=Haladaptatus sp. CMSO5 TaxID=3120514 RepID=UPI002FCDE91E